MKKIFVFLLSVVALVSLFGAEDENLSEKFRKKYGLDKAERDYSQEIKLPDIDRSILGPAQDIKITAFKERHSIKEVELNESNEASEAAKAAQKLYEKHKSQEIQDGIKAMTRHIIDDEEYRQHAAKYYEKAIKEAAITNNKYLSSGEQIFIVLSSSLPKGVIKSYFEDIDRTGAAIDVKFVFRGFMDNDIKNLKGSAEYIQRIMHRKGEKYTSETTEKDFYKVSVDINPKITRKYNIERVPAVIFIKNYDQTAELPKSVEEALSADEKYFVVYGATRLSYALGKINAQAKSDGLKRLVAALNKSGFFNDKTNQTNKKEKQ
jgi:type-F conjugative transfer system pilin assembly protein TrbC